MFTECLARLLHSRGALVEEIDLAIVIEKEALAKSTISAGNIEGPEE